LTTPVEPSAAAQILLQGTGMRGKLHAFHVFVAYRRANPRHPPFGFVHASLLSPVDVRRAI
jgi:hypothetical protein